MNDTAVTWLISSYSKKVASSDNINNKSQDSELILLTYCFIFFLWWFRQSRFWSINSKNVSKSLSIEPNNHIVVLNVFHCPLSASLTNLKCLHNSLSNCSSDMLWIELPLMLTNMLCHQHTSPKSAPWQTQCVIVLPEQGKLQLVWIDPSRHLLLLYIQIVGTYYPSRKFKFVWCFTMMRYWLAMRCYWWKVCHTRAGIKWNYVCSVNEWLLYKLMHN